MEPLAGNPSTAYLGLGSNLGDRPGNLARAVRLLDSAAGVQVGKCSSIYETEPWGLLDQPRFLNCALQITTVLAPGPLLELAKSIEQEMGRQPGPRYGPRPIDIDILLFDNLGHRLENSRPPNPPSTYVPTGLCPASPGPNRRRSHPPANRGDHLRTGRLGGRQRRCHLLGNAGKRHN